MLNVSSHELEYLVFLVMVIAGEKLVSLGNGGCGSGIWMDDDFIWYEFYGRNVLLGLLVSSAESALST